MDNTLQTSKSYFQTLSRTYIFLIIGQLLFGLLIVFLMLKDKDSSIRSDLNDIFIYVMPFFAITGVVGSIWFFHTKMKAIKEKDNLRLKMTSYKEALISRYGFLEGTSFFGFIVTMVTNNFLFLAIPILFILYFLYLKPSKEKIIVELELTQQEIAMVEDPECIIAEIKNFKY